MEKLDRTLEDAAETARSKMQHQLEKLQSQAARAEAQKGELVVRKAEYLSNSLYPEKGLQERGVGAIYFLARYGDALMRDIYGATHTDCPHHKILEMWRSPDQPYNRERTSAAEAVFFRYLRN